MKLNFAAAKISAVLLLAFASSVGRAAQPTGTDWKTVDVVQTNSTPRFVTNVIEVRVPNNVFVNQYRTNYVEQRLTNTVTVNLVRTNVVERYQTNWTTQFVTNSATLNLTNWETVVVTRTNWIRQPMTNVIEVTAPISAPVLTKEEPVKVETKIATPPPAEPSGDVLTLEATKTARSLNNNEVEVNFKARLTSDAAAPLQVQWRVERDDGAVLFFAQTQEFKRVVPTGRYQILIKARRDGDSPLLTLQTKLDVGRDAVARR
jgi:hypothetical protein